MQHSCSKTHPVESKVQNSPGNFLETSTGFLVLVWSENMNLADETQMNGTFCTLTKTANAF